ncbi:unnamed protein product [Caenorhabditis nigoni]
MAERITAEMLQKQVNNINSSENEKELGDFASRKDGMVLDEEGKQLQSSFAEYSKKKSSVMVEYEDFKSRVEKDPIPEDLQDKAKELFLKLTSLQESLGKLSVWLTQINQGQQKKFEGMLEALLTVIIPLYRSLGTVRKSMNAVNEGPNLEESVESCWNDVCEANKGIGHLRLDGSFISDRDITKLMKHLDDVAGCTWFQQFLDVVGQKDLEKALTYKANIDKFIEDLKKLMDEIRHLSGLAQSESK